MSPAPTSTGAQAANVSVEDTSTPEWVYILLGCTFCMCCATGILFYFRFSKRHKSHDQIHGLEAVHALPSMSTHNTGIHDITAEGGPPGGPGSLDMIGVPSGSSGSDLDDRDIVDEINTADVEGAGADRSAAVEKMSSVSTVQSDFEVLQMGAPTMGGPMPGMPEVNTKLLNQNTSGAGAGDEESSDDEHGIRQQPSRHHMQESQDVDNIAVDEIVLTNQVLDVIRDPGVGSSDSVVHPNDEYMTQGHNQVEIHAFDDHDIENHYTIG